MLEDLILKLDISYRKQKKRSVEIAGKVVWLLGIRELEKSVSTSISDLKEFQHAMVGGVPFESPIEFERLIVRLQMHHSRFEEYRWTARLLELDTKSTTDAIQEVLDTTCAAQILLDQDLDLPENILTEGNDDSSNRGRVAPAELKSCFSETIEVLESFLNLLQKERVKCREKMESLLR